MPIVRRESIGLDPVKGNYEGMEWGFLDSLLTTRKPNFLMLIAQSFVKLCIPWYYPADLCD